MELRKYHKEDSAVICGWIRDEKSLYQWSASRIGKFPLADNDLNEAYAPMIKGNRFIPLSALDDNGKLVGHLYIRYPNENDDSTVRFGFVIVDPVLRGCGNGRKMLQLAINYAQKVLHAAKITLGVFANNDSAEACYKSVGFRPAGKTEIYKMPVGEWECIEMECEPAKTGCNGRGKMYTVVEGEEQDIDSWMELVEGVRWNFPGLETEKALEEHKNTVLKFIKQKRAICVKDEDKIIGVLLFSTKYNMICCLAVSADSRKQGIGSLLLARALEKLDRTQAVTVSTFRAEDQKGMAPRALYKKYGFTADELIEEFGYPNQKFILYPDCRIMDIYGDNYSGITKRCREASRAIIVENENIMLSHETKIGQWMLPGGGIEVNENPRECCIRETAEETGLIVEPKRCFLIMNEYYEDWKFVSYYFECTVTGRTGRKPTDRERRVGAIPEWVAITDAMDTFSQHQDYAQTNEERRGIYLREYKALTAFME